jgi:hypothetical protein
MSFLLFAHLASTWSLVGLIWFVQVVHYPLMRHVGNSDFKVYESLHMSRTTWIVAPLMMTELGTNLLLFWRPGGLHSGLLGIGLMLLAVIWLSTYFLQVPQHQRLSEGFDAMAHRRLVMTNWTRTMAWTARGIWTFWLLRAAI